MRVEGIVQHTGVIRFQSLQVAVIGPWSPGGMQLLVYSTIE